MHLWCARIFVAVFASAALAAPLRAVAAQSLCEEHVGSVPSSREGVPGVVAIRVDRAVSSAVALVRFHRTDEATAKLDRAIALVDGPAGQRVEERLRSELARSLHGLRDCLADADPPAVASVTIRPVVPGESKTAEPSAVSGAYVDVEGVRVGRTGADGTLQTNVPSGEIRIAVTEYPSSWGEAIVTLAPGASRVISVPLDDSKEPSETSDLNADEAPDGILPSGAASLTLRFVQDEAAVTIARIESVELWDSAGEVKESFERLFKVRNGSMVATDAGSVYRRIAKHQKVGQPLSLFAYAIDAEGRNHYGTVSFEVGRWTLRGQLAAPPSNPALPVSNIAVRISVIGADIAFARVSDADGRFAVDTLPDATVALDAEAIAAGVHYYTHATVTMCADRRVTVPLLNVKDLVAGVRELVVDPSSPPCPPVPRH